MDWWKRWTDYTGRLFDQFRSGEKRAGREHVFFYTSDHGEQLGKRGIFGKQTLYEDAVRVPLIAADSTKTGQNLIKQEPVSLLQVREMILEAAGLKQEPDDRSEPVYIQQILERRGELLMGEAALWFPYKAGSDWFQAAGLQFGNGSVGGRGSVCFPSGNL